VIPVGGKQVAEDRLGGGLALSSADAPQPQSAPKVIVPRAASLTRRPELPSNV
jgi:hypothetical protein